MRFDLTVPFELTPAANPRAITWEGGRIPGLNSGR